MTTDKTIDDMYVVHSINRTPTSSRSYKVKLDERTKQQIQALITEARVDENESLLSVAEHEIGLPDYCDMHNKYSTHCHACKKRKWYGEISKDWKRIIEIRLKQLKGGSDE